MDAKPKNFSSANEAPTPLTVAAVREASKQFTTTLRLAVDPTPAQLEVLRVIESYRQARGFSPTFRELAKLMRRSLSTVVEHIDAMHEIGFIECIWPHDQRPRNFRLSDRALIFLAEHQAVHQPNT